MRCADNAMRYLALLCLVTQCLPLQAGEQKQTFTCIATELQVRSRAFVTLTGALMRVGPGGTRRTIGPKLEKITYVYRLLEVCGTQTKDLGTRLAFCYELAWEENGAVQAWQVWLDRPDHLRSGEFQLVNADSGNNYLAWVSGSILCFAEVSATADKLRRIQEFVSKGRAGNGVSVPVSSLVPEVGGWGQNAVRYSIRVGSISRDDQGNLVVKISPPMSDRPDHTAVSISEDTQGNWVVRTCPPQSEAIYTLISDKTAKLGWRLAQQQPAK